MLRLSYKPKKYNPQKIKKSEEICLLLEKNIDILKEMSSKVTTYNWICLEQKTKKH